MPLWLLAAALAAAAPARAESPAAPAPAVQQVSDAVAALSDLDRALLKDAGYQVLRDGVHAPDGALVADDDLLALLAKLRAAQSRRTLADLEQLQDEYFKNGKLTPEQRLKGQIALAKNWDLLPAQARDGFNTLLKEAGGKPVGGMDLGWVERVTASWQKSVQAAASGTEPGPRGGVWTEPSSGALAKPPDLEIARRLRRVQNATFKDPATGRLTPYPDDIKRALYEVVRFASDQDSAAVLKVIEKRHPVITRDNKQMFANADGVARNPSFYDTGKDAVYRLALPDSYVFAPPPKGQKNGIDVPIVEAPFYTELGVPAPQLDALSGQKPTSTDEGPGGTYDRFPDGSWRFHPYPETQAPVLLHELLHLATASDGGGAHALTNEMRSFLAQKRMVYNRDAAYGETKKPGYGADEADFPWLKSPLQYRARILGVYMSPAVGEVQTDRVLVASQLDATDKALAASGAQFERLRQAELDRRLDVIAKERKSIFDELEQKHLLSHEDAERGRDAVDRKINELRQSPDFQSWDYRAALQDERRRLLRDQATALDETGDDIRFHDSLGIPYAGGKK